MGAIWSLKPVYLRPAYLDHAIAVEPAERYRPRHRRPPRSKWRAAARGLARAVTLPLAPAAWVYAVAR